jgi:hypothetical protein
MDFKKCGERACTALLKTLLLIFNLIFFALGVSILISGIYGYRAFKHFFQFVDSTHLYLFVISLGVFMVMIGVLSLWCTPKGVTWLLYGYGAIVFILFLAVLATSVAFLVRRDPLENELKRDIERLIRTYPQNQESIDIWQTTLHCCGVQNYTDWFQTEWANGTHQVPKSCCIHPGNLNCTTTILSLNGTDITGDIWTEGCNWRMYNWLETNYAMIGGLGLGVAFFIFFGSLLSCSLAYQIRRNVYIVMQ